MSFKKKNVDTVFATADVQSAGHLDAGGVHSVLVECGYPTLLFVRVAALLRHYDGNGDGRLTLAETKKLHSYLQRGHNVVDEMHEALMREISEMYYRWRDVAGYSGVELEII